MCISELYEYYSVIVPKIMAGDMKLMNRVIKDHATGVKELCCLRSRWVFESHSCLMNGVCTDVYNVLYLYYTKQTYRVYNVLYKTCVLYTMYIVLICWVFVVHRCINGSTLLHTAAYYGHKETIRELLRLRVDINVRDYKGATPLHRSKNTEIMEVCFTDLKTSE